MLKEELGNYTFEDVVKELEKPGLDPREEFVPFEFRKDIHFFYWRVLGELFLDQLTGVRESGRFCHI